MAEHTPTPWAWSSIGGGISLISNAPMKPIVMDFVRMGMNGAAPRFNVDMIMVRADELAVRPESHNPWKITGIDHPDAAFIVTACNAHDALVTVLEVLITAHEQLLAQSPRSMADWGDGLILRDARAALKLAKGGQS